MFADHDAKPAPPARRGESAGPADPDADLGHFAGTFNPGLPVIDLGYGDGRQTRFLAKHFPHVARSRRMRGRIAPRATFADRFATLDLAASFQGFDGYDEDGAD